MRLTRKILPGVLALLAAVPVAAIAQDVPVAPAKPGHETTDVDTNIVFDKTDGVLRYRSPFDAPTSVKLTAIVRKAKDSITKFDDTIPAIRTLVSKGAAAPQHSMARAKALAAIKQLNMMHQPAIKASAEIKVARVELVASKQYFNNTVLSGMEKFIADVNAEFDDEMKMLSSKLQQS